MAKSGTLAQLGERTEGLSSGKHFRGCAIYQRSGGSS